MSKRLLITGWSLHLPGIGPEPAFGAWAAAEAVPPERAALVLGRKGLLYKEPATRLALCAVHRALGFAPEQRPAGPVDPATAVIACGNLGNVETVAKVVRTVAADGGRAVSVLDAPNVSSNVIASNVALWFGFGGPNLMLCSGPTSGRAGLRMAGLLLRSGRARRVVLVGAEPDDPVATALYGGRLRAGAACAVLTAWTPGDPVGPDRAVVDLEPVPGATPPACQVGPGGIDPMTLWGDYYGGHGVVELALAAHLAVHERYGAVGVGPVVTVRSADPLTEEGCP